MTPLDYSLKSGYINICLRMIKFCSQLDIDDLIIILIFRSITFDLRIVRKWQTGKNFESMSMEIFLGQN